MDSCFPFEDPLQVGEEFVSAEDIVAALHDMLTESRRQRIAEVVAGRTFRLAVVLDQLYDRGNQAAVFRTAEALGFVNVHSVETFDKFKAARRVARGANKWVEQTVWPRADECYRELRRQGFALAVCTPGGEHTPENLDLTGPVAVVFGNEHSGVCDEFERMADYRLSLPMFGFVESYNISVAAGICLSEIHRRRRDEADALPGLTKSQQKLLRAVYFLRSVRYPERLLFEQLRRMNGDD